MWWCWRCSNISAVPLAILDRANTRTVHGAVSSAAQVFAEVTIRAKAAEQAGYHRFWVAEHHSVPGIAGSAPTILLAHVAGATNTIRLGTGGIMVPSHQPLVIAEQVGTLQALYGDRLDIGLGASTGFTRPVRLALRQDDGAGQRFGADVAELIQFLDGTGPVSAYPPDAGGTPLFVLTGGGSAQFAASNGLGLVLGGPIVTGTLKHETHEVSVLEQYRHNFLESALRSQRPRVIASVNVSVAHTSAEARLRALSEAWALTLSRSTGVFGPLESPEVLRQREPTAQQRRRLERNLATTVYGTPQQVVEQLRTVVTRTGADELMITGNMWDPAAQLDSDALLVEAWHAG